MAGTGGIRRGVQKRLLKELVDCEKNQESGQHVQLSPLADDDLSEWMAILVPQSPSLYEGGTFEMAISITPGYPIEPPRFKFVTRLCHPNVHARSGEICLDVLKSEWSPAWTLHAACLAVLVLLDNPDPTSPLNCDAGNLLRANDLRGYSSLVRMTTMLHATKNESGRPSNAPEAGGMGD